MNAGELTENQEKGKCNGRAEDEGRKVWLSERKHSS